MIDIKFNLEEKRAIALDGEKEVGEATFSSSDNTWIVDHTYTDDTYREQGIARRLVDKVAEAARENNKKLTATCPYALKVYKEDEYKDVFLG